MASRSTLKQASSCELDDHHGYEMKSMGQATGTTTEVTDQNRSDAKGGTALDQQDMHRMNKPQELRRNFRFLSIFGYSLLLGNGWCLSIVGLLIPLTNGGSAGTIWMYLIVIFGMIFSTLSMAELASMAPTAGGQYHWVSEFAPPEYQRFLSYLTGWLCVLGWQTALCSTAYSGALAVQGMIALSVPGYTALAWHGVLLTIGGVVFTIFFSQYPPAKGKHKSLDSNVSRDPDTILLRKLPAFEGAMLVVYIFGFFAMLIVLWVMGDRAPAREVWFEFEDAQGWGSIGVAMLVGSLSASGSLVGADSAAHLGEELKDASWVLPRSMISCALFNYMFTFLMVVTILTVKGGAADELVNTEYVQPYVQIYLNVTQSKGGALALTALTWVLIMFGIINQVTTASRQLWSFARDRGLPWSHFLGRVQPGWEVPLNALVVTLLFSIIVSTIILGSPVAFFTLGSLCNSALYASYVICIGCVVRKRIVGEPLLPSRFDLGPRLGLVINLIAIAFAFVQFLFVFFPTAPNPTAPYFNWTLLVFVVVVLWSVVYFFLWGKQAYQGPVIYVRRIE